MPAAPEPAAPPEAGNGGVVELEENPSPMAWALSGAAAAEELRELEPRAVSAPGSWRAAAQSRRVS